MRFINVTNNISETTDDMDESISEDKWQRNDIFLIDQQNLVKCF